VAKKLVLGGKKARTWWQKRLTWWAKRLTWWAKRLTWWAKRLIWWAKRLTWWAKSGLLGTSIKRAKITGWCQSADSSKAVWLHLWTFWSKPCI